MKHIKEYNQFVVNEEEGLLKNLLLSTILSLGIKYADAQVIQQDSIKTGIVNSISNFNKSIILNTYGGDEIPLIKLKKDLFNYQIEDPDTFVEKYLGMRRDGTLIVKPNFIEGLELHLKRNQVGLGYNINF